MENGFDLLMFNGGSGGGKKGSLPKGAFGMLQPARTGNRSNRTNSTNRTNRKKKANS